MMNDAGEADFLGQYIGNYCLLRLLGRGSFASVYLGKHRYLDRFAAVKMLHTVLDDQDKEQFLTEAKLLAKLSHPNIVQIHEFAVTPRINHAGGRKFMDYLPYFIMDFAPGGSLRNSYPAGSCLFSGVAINYIKQIANALQYAHDNGIIHRDVKPENCLLNERQEVMLSDFGLALFAPTPNLLSTQQMAGTLPYTAPEQLRGKPDFASDQYSLGIMAYEWLCGHRPFFGEGVELIVQHMSSPPPSLRHHNPAVSPVVEEVVLKALEKNPLRRYPSVQAFAHALERANDWRVANFSPYSHVTMNAFSSDQKKIDDPAPSFSSLWEVEELYSREAKRSQADEESYAPLIEQESTAKLVRKAQKRRWRPLSLSSGEGKKRPLLIIGVLASMLMLVSSGLYYYLQYPKQLSVSAHPAVTSLPVTSPSSLSATADFTTSPTSIQGMVMITNQTSFEGDHSVLNADQQVVADFVLHFSPGPGKSKLATVVIRALVSRLGNQAGYAPIDLYCNGQAFIHGFTIPGDGFQPESISFQIPTGQLVPGKNEFRLLVSSNAVSKFWIYSIRIMFGTIR